MGSESRRMPRRTVSGLIDVVDAMTEESIGHLGNLSVGGMLLIARAPLAEDGLYQLRFSPARCRGAARGRRACPVAGRRHRQRAGLGRAAFPRIGTRRDPPTPGMDAPCRGRRALTIGTSRARPDRSESGLTLHDFGIHARRPVSRAPRHPARPHRGALARGGFDHLVVPSGTLHYQAFDDRDYPYAVNPQFKAWLPVTRAPGSWLVATRAAAQAGVPATARLLARGAEPRRAATGPAISTSW